jgi:hypothetical protein
LSRRTRSRKSTVAQVPVFTYVRNETRREIRVELLGALNLERVKREQIAQKVVLSQ